MNLRTLTHYDLLATETVAFSAEGDALTILDQSRLPNEIVLLDLTKPKEIWEAIHSLQVRGAPAIGVAAAIGIAVTASTIPARNFSEFWQEFRRQKEYLATARPTAINLFWALEQMEQVVLTNQNVPVSQIKAALREAAETIKNQDIATCRAIGEHGFPLIQNCRRLLTHCNAGQLATVKYGTALAPIYIAKERGLTMEVFSDETRPLLQGARLTAFELTAAGIPTTTLCDNMAAGLMADGKIDAVLVGADRIAANGDTANKIGTLGVAVLAHHFHVPFYVCAPTNTIDFQTPTGKEIPIEERNETEVRSLWYRQPMVPAAAKIYNPAFDVTPAELITAVITEKGAYPPRALSRLPERSVLP